MKLRKVLFGVAAVVFGLAMAANSAQITRAANAPAASYGQGGWSMTTLRVDSLGYYLNPASSADSTETGTYPKSLTPTDTLLIATFPYPVKLIGVQFTPEGNWAGHDTNTWVFYVLKTTVAGTFAATEDSLLLDTSHPMVKGVPQTVVDVAASSVSTYATGTSFWLLRKHFGSGAAAPGGVITLITDK